MFRHIAIQRGLMFAAVVLPASILLGYLLTTPGDFQKMALASLMVGALCLPLLLRWHHIALICLMNASINVFFLPGQPSLWMVLAFVSLGVSFVTGTLDRKQKFLNVPSIGWPLIALAVVVLITAAATGGIGGRALGSEHWGAKRYLGVLSAIAAFFAITAKPVPRHLVLPVVSVFILGGVTAVISNLIFYGGPAFYFLYNVFPVELANMQAISDRTHLQRLTGVCWAAMSICFYMMMRFGIRGIFDLTRPWRVILYFTFFLISLVGGFRSTIITIMVVFTVQFLIERLYRGRFFVMFFLSFSIVGAFLVAFSERLPLTIQRSISFLPVNVHPIAKNDAEGTLNWRLEMWKVVTPQIPQYLLLGKGFSYDGTDYYLTQQAVRKRMLSASYEDTLISGNYHQGILTLIIPFGIWGLLAFTWFCAGSIRVLYLNYRYGDLGLRRLNTFLLAYFVGRLIFYVVFYGQFDLDLFLFVGVVALSISVNHGVAGPSRLEDAESKDEAEEKSAVSPAAQGAA